MENNLLIGDKISKFRKLIKIQFIGISSLLQKLIEKYNIKNHQIGGEIKKIRVGNNDINIDIVFDSYDEGSTIHVVNLKDKTDCGVILIYNNNKTKAVIQNIRGNDNCYMPTIKNMSNGKIIMKILIEICRNNGIRKIVLGDISKKQIGKYLFNLSKYNTMINGKPWYSQFGFINTKQQDKIDYNYNLLFNKKVRDFDKNIYINKTFIDIYDKYKDNDIKEFIKLLSIYDIKIFYKIYKKLYKKLGLKSIKNKNYYLMV